MKAGDLQMQIGLVIRTHRLAQKISQEAFADEIGMHRTYYGAVERGEKNVTLWTLYRVSAGLRVALSALFGSVEGSRTQGCTCARSAGPTGSHATACRVQR